MSVIPVGFVTPHKKGGLPPMENNGSGDVSLLLRCDDSEWTDTSGNNLVPSQVVNASLDTSVKRSGVASLRFSGNGRIVYSSNPLFGFGTGDFTIETWLYKLPGGNFFKGLISTWAYPDNRLILWRHQPGNGDALYVGNSSIAYWWNPPVNSPDNEWVHLALVRGQGSVRIYANGTQVLSVANSADLGSTAPLMIGASPHSTGEAIIGHFDDIRVTKGVARYTSNFVPDQY